MKIKMQKQWIIITVTIIGLNKNAKKKAMNSNINNVKNNNNDLS